MNDNTNYNDMRITTRLQEWLRNQEWEDDIEVDEGHKNSLVSTNIVVNGQGHRLYLEVDEELEIFKLFMYGIASVPISRTSETAIILNKINSRLNLGRLTCTGDDETNPIQYKSAIDVEESDLSPKQITNMLDCATLVFDEFGFILSQVALTKQSGDEIWLTFLEEEDGAEQE